MERGRRRQQGEKLGGNSMGGSQLLDDHSDYTDDHSQFQRQAIHPSPSPVPYPPQPPLQAQTAGNGGRYSSARRHSSATANQSSDTLRRRTVASILQPDDPSESNHDVESSFLSFSGLDMPATSEDPTEQHDDNIGDFSDHLLPHNYYHENAGLHHNVNPHVIQRLHNSLTNVHISTAKQHSTSLTSQSQHSNQSHQQYFPRTSHAHHSHSPSVSRRRPSTQSTSHHEEDDSVSIASNASRRRRQSSLTPQHQLDRKNSRRRVTQPPPPIHQHTTNNTATSAVPNRYYLAGKAVQTEWSSPTRQRRSRSSLNNSHHQRGNSSNSNSKPKSKSSLADRDSPTNHQNHIIVLPSISVPNGNHDDYRHNTHPSQIKPPSFPQRRACVHATSMVCNFGTFKWCVMIQIILVIPLCLYVFDAHVQKKHAKQQLQQYNEEHEHILNQMMWMDQAAKKLNARHKHNARMMDPNNPDSPLRNNDPNNFFESYYADNSATEDLRDSVHKLRGQMRDMQYRIQQNSKARITEKYGEGPIRVYVHPEPEDPVLEAAAAGPAGNPQEMTPEIALELFIEDTPHAVSTFLYQIERGHWNRVQMNWKGETTILSKPGSSVTSGMGDWMQTSRLEFLEQFPIKHCEVALVQEGQMGVLSLQINLVEVPFQDQEEVCIGRLLNDRLVLPKARGYFMAEFTTRSLADGVGGAPQENQQQAQHEQQQQTRQPESKQQKSLPPVEARIPRTPPPHQPPPPILEENQQTKEEKPILMQAESDHIQTAKPKPRLRGRADEAKAKEHDDISQQVIRPLEEPGQPGDPPPKDDDALI